MCSWIRTVWAMTMLLLSLSGTGCAAPERVGIEYCDHARPIYFKSGCQISATPNDVRRQVLELNKTWSRLCESGWWEGMFTQCHSWFILLI